MTEMPEMCDFEPVEVSIEMQFMVCRDHGSAHANGGLVRVPDILSPYKVVSTTLGLLEQTIGGLLAQHPEIDALISAKYHGEDLDHRAKNRVLTLLANTHLQKMVARADWERPDGVEFQTVVPD